MQIQNILLLDQDNFNSKRLPPKNKKNHISENPFMFYRMIYGHCPEQFIQGMVTNYAQR